MKHTPGPWEWLITGNGWDGLTLELVSKSDVWERCNHYCLWNEGAEGNKGTQGKPGHYHRKGKVILNGWGYDAWGLDINGGVDEIIEQRNLPDAKLIATAPDLLEVCRFVEAEYQAHGFHEARSDFDECHDRLTAVIAKAENG